MLRRENPNPRHPAVRGQHRTERGDRDSDDEGRGGGAGRRPDDDGHDSELRPRGRGQDQAGHHGAGHVPEAVGPGAQGQPEEAAHLEGTARPVREAEREHAQGVVE